MKAFITGISGQDGSYLAELLLSYGCEVVGLVRRASNPAALVNIEPFHALLKLYLGDILDQGRIETILREETPDIVFNLAAQSHVGSSQEITTETVRINGLGAFTMMEATHRSLPPNTPFIQACTADMFADVPGPLDENSPIQARNPYAVGKMQAYEAGRYFRETGRLAVTNCILFNHESPRRPETFVTRKVTKAVARIKLGVQKQLEVGNLGVARDWGAAEDTVRAIRDLWGRTAGDYVVATGKLTTLEQFIEIAFKCAELDYKDYVSVSRKFLRKDDFVNPPFGNSAKLQSVTGWKPEISLEELIKKMIIEDLKRERRAFL